MFLIQCQDIERRLSAIRQADRETNKQTKTRMTDTNIHAHPETPYTHTPHTHTPPPTHTQRMLDFLYFP